MIKFRVLHPTARERFEKLKRVYHRLLDEDFNRHDLDDFIHTAGSLPGCIERDPTTSKAQKNEAKRMCPGLDWKICNQIANQQKHFKPATRCGAEPALVKSVQVKPGAAGFLDLSRRRVIEAGEEIRMEHPDGSKTDAVGTVYRMFRHFEYIFENLPSAKKQKP